MGLVFFCAIIAHCPLQISPTCFFACCLISVCYFLALGDAVCSVLHNSVYG